MSGVPPRKRPLQDGEGSEVNEEGRRAGGGSRGTLSGAWSFLKAPSDKDIRGKRRSAKAFDRPVKPYDFLVVMDFEWTCDNRKKLEPLEIIEFPAVLVRCSFPPQIIDDFQVYCKPAVNPKLSPFCTQLTAITQLTEVAQEMVDAGVPLSKAMQMHTDWLQRHGLLDLNDVSLHNHKDAASHACKDDTLTRARCREGEGSSDEDEVEQSSGGGPRFCIVTWGDSDVMTALHSELTRLGINRPAHFDNWINLKALFKSHYKREARGGLQACVEGCGIKFEGRAHSGLVDSRNTAAIVVQMIQQGFTFTRSTRGFGPDGEAWGSKRRQQIPSALFPPK